MADTRLKYRGDMKYKLLSVGSVLAFLLIWQLLMIAGILPARTLASPLEVFSTFLEKLHSPDPDGATIQKNIVVSLGVAMTGLLLAIVIGTPLGLLMGWYKGVDRFVKPLFEIIRPIPPVAWIPLTILWVGIGLQAKAMIIFFAAFVPCVINSYVGIRETNPTLINVAKTFGATKFQTFLRVGVPSAMPLSFAGIRIALGNAWATLVAAELLVANAGLGYMISMGRQFVRPDIIILGMFTIAVLGLILTSLFDRLERVVLRWRTV